MVQLELNEEFYEKVLKARQVGGYESDHLLYLFIACHPGLTEQEILNQCDDGDEFAIKNFIEENLIKIENGKLFAV